MVFAKSDAVVLIWLSECHDCTGRCTMQEHENGDHVRNPESPLTGHPIDVTLVEFEKWSERVFWQVFTLAGHSDLVVSVDFSPDGKHVASGSWDNSVKIWNAETGAEVSSFVGLRGVW